MRNYIQPGDSLTLAAPAAVISGQGVQIGQLFGVASGDAANGAPVVLSTTGVFELRKTTTDVVTVGASLYWDSSEGELTVTATDNLFVGHAVKAAGNPSTTATVRLSI